MHEIEGNYTTIISTTKVKAIFLFKTIKLRLPQNLIQYESHFCLHSPFKCNVRMYFIIIKIHPP